MGEAYQVLGSEELRAKYDKEGRKALEEHPLVRPPPTRPRPLPHHASVRFV